MIRRISTRSGAVYLIDDLECIWHRIPGDESEELRSNAGIFKKCIIAERVVLHCPAFDTLKPDLERVIVSSIVESIEAIEFGTLQWEGSS